VAVTQDSAKNQHTQCTARLASPGEQRRSDLLSKSKSIVEGDEVGWTRRWAAVVQAVASVDGGLHALTRVTGQCPVVTGFRQAYIQAPSGYKTPSTYRLRQSCHAAMRTTAGTTRVAVSSSPLTNYTRYPPGTKAVNLADAAVSRDVRDVSSILKDSLMTNFMSLSLSSVECPVVSGGVLVSIEVDAVQLWTSTSTGSQTDRCVVV